MKRSCFILLLIFHTIVFSQDYDLLLQQKKRLSDQLKDLNKVLNINQTSQRYTVDEIVILNTKIHLQEKKIEVFESEGDILKRQERELQDQLEIIGTQLEELKKTYQRLIKKTYFLSQTYNPILFYFSSTSFNQLIRRFYFLKHLETDRRKQYETILILESKVKTQKLSLKQKRAAQSELLLTKRQELSVLAQTKQIKQKMIQTLKIKQDSLLDIIFVKKQRQQQIADEILKFIESEKENTLIGLNEISESFLIKKGTLSWPTNEAIVVKNFGNIPHPVLSGITTMSNGIEVATNNPNIRSVFSGEVRKIIILTNGKKVVIIRHGVYLSVYSNLTEVTVEIGQKVKEKERIGILSIDKDKKKYNYGFQIWKDREKLNPRHWLSSY